MLRFDLQSLPVHIASHLVDETKEPGGIRDVDGFIDLMESGCGRAGTLLVLIDEAQFLEPSGLDLLLQIADRGEDANVRLVLILAGGPELEGQFSLAAPDHGSVRKAEIKRLENLRNEEVRVFVRAQLSHLDSTSHSFSDGALERLSALTRGVPR